ncbi:hypothetical protein KS4_10440 [Poriferisphaera corsica]|uniref:Uncharacterized protein n=1 Tax=Poriferisphaera corsica TaxID=2528020 RepID=A0A517YS04_9BACT|nr:hypothetical protein [Poriferisphaera corsica]QDU33005.1 hypothetical protein KS4_10440 [Poriferisphaera corsica]
MTHFIQSKCMMICTSFFASFFIIAAVTTAQLTPLQNNTNTSDNENENKDVSDDTKKTDESMTDDEIVQLITDSMAEKLDLDDNQKAKVLEINKKYIPQMRDLKSSDEPRFKKLRKFREISRARQSELKEVLTKEQYKKQEQMREQFIAMIKERRQKQNDE